MTKLFTAITFAFLLGVTIAGCASERQWLEGVKAEQSPPIWRGIADRGE